MAETSLHNIPGWTDALIERLQSVWITNAEQVLALSATPNGICSLASQLEVTEDEAAALVDSIRNRLAPDEVNELTSPVDTSDFGRGALNPHN
jgi:hypothetical protein